MFCTYPEFPKQSDGRYGIIGCELDINKPTYKFQCINIDQTNRTYRSKTELDMYRKEENVRTLEAVKAKWDEKHPPSVPMTYK